MRILYICDKLITFILNEIIELNKNNDIFILSEHSKRTYDVINKPILNKNGLDKNYYMFSSVNSRTQKYICFIKNIIYDFFVHPICTIKALIYILIIYQKPKFGVVDYLDVRVFFGSGIDIIHSPFSTPRIIDKVYLLSKILNVPFTLSFRAHDIYEGNNIREAQKRINIINEASQIMTISDYNKSYIEEAFRINVNMDIIHSAINPELFMPKEVERLGKSIITVCRLHEQKGLIYLINACYILKKRNVEYTCTIIGEGPEKKEYEKLIDELQIPNINFIDFLSYDEVKEHLNRSKVFVLPCVIAADGKRDILANSLKEAMAMQVPVITSNICGIEELVDDGISGILVPPQNPEAIAYAIENIFNNPEQGMIMGEEGRKKIEKDFNVKIETGKLENIFIKTLNHKSKERICEEDKIICEDTDDEATCLAGTKLSCRSKRE